MSFARLTPNYNRTNTNTVHVAKGTLRSGDDRPSRAPVRRSRVSIHDVPNPRQHEKPPCQRRMRVQTWLHCAGQGKDRRRDVSSTLSASLVRTRTMTLTTGAKNSLRDALEVTGARKDTMPAEHARCLFKLSEALRQVPGSEAEALEARKEAERLLFLRAPGCTLDTGDESTYDGMVEISWR